MLKEVVYYGRQEEYEKSVFIPLKFSLNLDLKKIIKGRLQHFKFSLLNLFCFHIGV